MLRIARNERERRHEPSAPEWSVHVVGRLLDIQEQTVPGLIVERLSAHLILVPDCISDQRAELASRLRPPAHWCRSDNRWHGPMRRGEEATV